MTRNSITKRFLMLGQIGESNGSAQWLGSMARLKSKKEKEGAISILYSIAFSLTTNLSICFEPIQNHTHLLTFYSNST